MKLKGMLTTEASMVYGLSFLAVLGVINLGIMVYDTQTLKARLHEAAIRIAFEHMEQEEAEKLCSNCDDQLLMLRVDRIESVKTDGLTGEKVTVTAFISGPAYALQFGEISAEAGEYDPSMYKRMLEGIGFGD